MQLMRLQGEQWALLSYFLDFYGQENTRPFSSLQQYGIGLMIAVITWKLQLQHVTERVAVDYTAHPSIATELWTPADCTDTSIVAIAPCREALAVDHTVNLAVARVLTVDCKTLQEVEVETAFWTGYLVVVCNDYMEVATAAWRELLAFSCDTYLKLQLQQVTELVAVHHNAHQAVVTAAGKGGFATSVWKGDSTC